MSPVSLAQGTERREMTDKEELMKEVVLKDQMITALHAEVESLKQEMADMMNRLNFYKGLSRGLEIAARCNSPYGDTGRKMDD